MNIIAAVDSSWGIGKNNQLLFNVSQDKKYFREMTTGKTIIMGRKTFESLPCGPLPGRDNIVLSHSSNFDNSSEITVCHSFEEIKNIIKYIDPDDIFVIGGEEIYKLFISLCDTAYITKISSFFPADKHMINLDENNEWKRISCSECYYFNNTAFRFAVYKRNNI